MSRGRLSPVWKIMLAGLGIFLAAKVLELAIVPDVVPISERHDESVSKVAIAFVLRSIEYAALGVSALGGLVLVGLRVRRWARDGKD